MARALAAALAAALLVVVPSAGGAPGAETPRSGGTLVALRLEPACLNPFACAVPQDDPAITQVLEGAFEVGPDLVPRPNLVSGVEIGRKPFTLTYHIRPEARWSDGVPVTASDFLFTQQAFARLETPALDERELYRKVRRARVVDAKTFRIELRAPFSAWHRLYRVVLPRHAVEGQDLTKIWIDRMDNPRTGRPIASGPFLVQRWERGKQLALGRNPGYWGPHTAYLHRFVWSFAQDRSDPLGPVRRDEFDVTLSLTGSNPLSDEHARGVRQVPGWRTRAWPASGAEHLVFRVAAPGGHPALRSTHVRRALAFGIDREEIARAFLGEAERSSRRPLDSTVLLPTEPFYRATWSGYRYDPARARRLFRQAGCRLGADSIQTCAGERLSLRFVTTAGNPARERALLLVHAQLRRVGVEAVLAYHPGAVLFQQVLPSGDFDVALFFWGNNGGGVVWPEARCGDVQNWAGYCSRLVMRDVQQTDLIIDQQQRAHALNSADAKLAGAVPVLPLVQGVQRAAVKTRVRGVTPGGLLFNFFQNSEDWWLARS